MRALSLALALALGACADTPGPPPAPPPADSTVRAASAPGDGALGEAAAGQLLYVPAYSHVYFGDRQRPVDLTAMLSVRNADPEAGIRLVRVQYVGSDGQPLRAYLDAPRALGPLATADFVVDRTDRSGGSGASFLVEWTAERPVATPVVEAVMISASGQQGISFVTQARVLAEADGP